MLRAGARELPAIVTDINGCNEIITEGENGLIIPVKDAAALQQAMEKMVSDTEAYEIMKAKARPLIESRYRQEVVWKALLEEYRQILIPEHTCMHAWKEPVVSIKDKLVLGVDQMLQEYVPTMSREMDCCNLSLRAIQHRRWQI